MARPQGAEQIYATVSKELKEKFQKYVQEKGISQNEALNKALELFLFDELKEKAPDMASVIDDFNSYQTSTMTLFKQVVDHSINARTDAGKRVQERIIGMEKMVSTYEKVQKENEEKEAENKRLSVQVTELEEKNDKLNKRQLQLNTDHDQLIELRQKVAALTQEKADLQTAHNEEIRKLQEDHHREILEIVRAATTPGTS